MEWVETTGRTVDEAKDAALDQLGVDEQDAEFEVIEEPKVGLFGRLRNEARVRARVRPTTPRPKEDRRGRRRQKDQRRSGGGGGRSTATSAPAAEASGDGGAEDDESGGGDGPRQKSKRGPRPARTRDNGRQSES